MNGYPHSLYGRSLALLTDLYQLTMAYGYWKGGLVERQAAFHLFFRENPFGGGFAVACGLQAAVEFLERFRFETDDIDYLRTLTGNDGGPLFSDGFLDYLSGLRLGCNVDAVPEGTPVFPNEPLIRVTGPILECQLLETPLLNLVNFPTLIATKAARVCLAAGDQAVIEFGLRRAQGIDGGVVAARAAYVGGCMGTSNVLAGRLFGIPVLGTHAHSWIMCFEDELKAFEVYARAMPNNCIFLVDTYDSIDGVKNAVRVARRMREEGHEMVGIRLDSGEMTALSIESRRLLDEAGFTDAKIVASSDLDEHKIAGMNAAGAKVDVWGVGTRLTTCFDDPALGGVYKLAAVRDPGQNWQPRIKLSNDPVKTTNPGVHQVRRFYDEEGKMLADAIYLADHPAEGDWKLHDPAEKNAVRTIPAGTADEDLLQPVLRGGRAVHEPPPLKDVRRRTLDQLPQIPEPVRRREAPERFPVALEGALHDLKQRLIQRKQDM